MGKETRSTSDELVDDKTRRRRELTSLPLADDAFLFEVLTPFENPGGSEMNRGEEVSDPPS